MGGGIMGWCLMCLGREAVGVGEEIGIEGGRRGGEVGAGIGIGIGGGARGRGARLGGGVGVEIGIGIGDDDLVLGVGLGFVFILFDCCLPCLPVALVSPGQSFSIVISPSLSLMLYMCSWLQPVRARMFLAWVSCSTYGITLQSLTQAMRSSLYLVMNLASTDPQTASSHPNTVKINLRRTFCIVCVRRRPIDRVHPVHQSPHNLAEHQRRFQDRRHNRTKLGSLGSGSESWDLFMGPRSFYIQIYRLHYTYPVYS